MPAARQASRSSAKALAVSAMIGVRGAASGLGGADAARRLEAVDARHVHVHQHEVVGRRRPSRADSQDVDRGGAVGRDGRAVAEPASSSARASSALISLSSATRIDRPFAASPAAVPPERSASSPAGSKRVAVAASRAASEAARTGLTR